MKPVIVVKLGGSSLGELPALLDFVQSCGEARMVLVHGGGPQLSAMLDRLGHKPEFREGLRVTDEASLEVALMVLAGSVNKQIVAAAQARGISAVGLCGIDGGTLRASLLQGGAWGRVGVIEEVKVDLLDTLLQNGFLPVLSPLALSAQEGALNVNADSVATAVALALKADRLVFLTNVDGLLDGDGRSLRTVTPQDLTALCSQGVIGDGMIPKIESAQAALNGGVKQVEIRRAKGGLGTTLLKGESDVELVCEL